MKLIKTIISKISLISLILLTLVSCGGGGDDDLGASQTAAVNNELVPITFNGSQGVEAAVTRASGTPLSETGVTHFHVWGYKDMPNNSPTQKVFPGYQVDWHDNSAATTTTNTNGWEYVGISDQTDQTIKYWDWGAKAYRFFAVTGWTGTTALDFTDAENANKTYGTDKTNEYEISMLVDASPVMDGEGKYKKDATDAKLALAPYFSRLWYSTGNPTDYPDKQFGKPVTLEFVKPYARVRFIYTYVYPREGITLSGQKFRPSVDVSAEEDAKVKIPRKGVVTVKYPLSGADKESYSMVADADKSTRLEAFTEDYDPDDDTKVYTTCDNGWYTVVPNTSQGSYTLSVKVNGGDTKTAVVPAEYMQWKPGYSYTYKFKITDEGGVEIGWVDYAVTPWTEMETDRTVYNW